MWQMHTKILFFTVVGEAFVGKFEHLVFKYTDTPMGDPKYIIVQTVNNEKENCNCFIMTYYIDFFLCSALMCECTAHRRHPL